MFTEPRSDGGVLFWLKNSPDAGRGIFVLKLFSKLTLSFI